MAFRKTFLVGKIDQNSLIDIGLPLCIEILETTILPSKTWITNNTFQSHQKPLKYTPILKQFKVKHYQRGGIFGGIR